MGHCNSTKTFSSIIHVQGYMHDINTVKSHIIIDTFKGKNHSYVTTSDAMSIQYFY